jgi:hypothetical protein
MKTRIFFVLFIILLVFSACSPGIKVVSTPDLYWNENEADTIVTNDMARLQKMIPFPIMLPEYLPDDLDSQLLEFLMRKDKNTDVVYLDINYYSSAGYRILTIHENLSSIELPRGVLSKMHPDYTSLEIKGVEVLEKNGFDYVIRSTQKIQVTRFSYNWNMNKMSFSCSFDGYDQVESRKIVESMIK